MIRSSTVSSHEGSPQPESSRSRGQKKRQLESEYW
jgi:hypothetical protein